MTKAWLAAVAAMPQGLERLCLALSDQLAASGLTELPPPLRTPD